MIFNYDVSDILSTLSNIDFAHAQNITTADTHLDDYTTGGVYYFSGNYEPTGKPDGATTGFGFLVVMNGATTSANYARLVQIWINQSTSQHNVWYRTCSTSTLSWSDWEKFMTSTDFAAKRIYPTIVSTLPTGVTSVDTVSVIHTHNVVTVHLSLNRDSSTMSSYQQIATGLPAPYLRPISGNATIPFGQILVNGAQSGRPLLCSVSTSGALVVARGETSGQYIGSFTYITNDY